MPIVIKLRNHIFYINYCSLIIFEIFEVWLGFELFGLRVQVHSHWVQFTLARKGYGSHHCHNKPLTWNEAGVWMTSCPEEMVLRIGGFWKRVSWELDLGRWRWVFLMSTDADLKHHKMGRALRMVNIVRIVSLSSCQRTEDRS